MVHRSRTARTTVAARRWVPPAMMTLAAMAALTALTADAAAKQARPAQLNETTAPRDAGEPIMAIVSIKTQHVTFYDTEGWILRAPVSTGTTGRETPAGVFAVVEKDKDHHSNMYDDAWMPNMQRITWNGIALHGGPLPGYAASHGCVRMPLWLCRKAVRQDADRDAGDHLAERRRARSSSPIRRCSCRRRRPSRPRRLRPRRSPARRPRPPKRPTRRRKPPRQRRARRHR